MIKQQFQTLYAYSWHTTVKLLEQAALLDEADYFEHPGYGHGSIHDLFVHLVTASRNWRINIETGETPVRLGRAESGTLELIRALVVQEGAAWQRHLERLSEEEIAGSITLTYRDETSALVYWRILQHLAFHSMQHNTELAQLLTNKGRSPGNIDFLFYAG